MSDVYAIFGTLLALGIAFPGLLTAWRLLFPGKVAAAQRRVAATPWKTFFMGLGSTLVALVPIFILISIPVPFSRFLGAITIFGVLGFAAIGAAGIAAHMGAQMRISEKGETNSEIGAFVRGAVALELAAAFPLIGWLVVIPVTLITSLGASVSALFGWEPKTKSEAGKINTAIAGEAEA
ncbi:MAG: hypothetical protein OEV06_12040 [Anaerolineae bacterium]|nr:hypothetical protein [Anaerolineae bacterium]